VISLATDFEVKGARIMNRFILLLLGIGLAASATIGCGSNSERPNDAGPPIQENPEGPGPMPLPEEGKSTLPPRF
jgi:hypothetical protein